MTAVARTDLMPNRFVRGEAPLDPTREALIDRRERVLGAGYRLLYREPVHFVRAENMYLFGSNGDAYLDFYNNVPSLGHCHPEVVAAISAQAARLNINTRYLDETVLEYAESLVATFPDEIDRVMFTCTGSESNDLALRIARHVTGGTGIIVSRHAYHGTSASTAEISPNLGGAVKLGAHVRTIPVPGAVSVPEDDAAAFLEGKVKEAMMDLDRHGVRTAAFVADTIFSSDGVHTDPHGYLAPAVDAVQKAGALFIADEVQPGFGRMGRAMWGFDLHGIVPDLVTLGKPMGNGYPIGAVVGKQRYVDGFGAVARYFNTQSGTTVAIAAAHAVLRILMRDRLMENAVARGKELVEGLNSMRDDGRVIGDVRGQGLFIGVSVGAAETSNAERRQLALDLVNALRQRKVLISLCGANEDTLKIRPPIVCSSEHVAMFLDRLKASMDEVST